VPGREGRRSAWQHSDGFDVAAESPTRGCFGLVPPAQQLTAVSLPGRRRPPCAAPLPCMRGGQARRRW
jgi:hypothetical protein